MKGHGRNLLDVFIRKFIITPLAKNRTFQEISYKIHEKSEKLQGRDPSNFNPYSRGYFPTPDEELNRPHILDQVDPDTRKKLEEKTAFWRIFMEEFFREIKGEGKGESGDRNDASGSQSKSKSIVKKDK